MDKNKDEINMKKCFTYSGSIYKKNIGKQDVTVVQTPKQASIRLPLNSIFLLANNARWRSAGPSMSTAKSTVFIMKDRRKAAMKPEIKVVW